MAKVTDSTSNSKQSDKVAKLDKMDDSNQTTKNIDSLESNGKPVIDENNKVTVLSETATPSTVALAGTGAIVSSSLFSRARLFSNSSLLIMAIGFIAAYYTWQHWNQIKCMITKQFASLFPQKQSKPIEQETPQETANTNSISTETEPVSSTVVNDPDIPQELNVITAESDIPVIVATTEEAVTERPLTVADLSEVQQLVDEDIGFSHEVAPKNIESVSFISPIMEIPTTALDESSLINTLENNTNWETDPSQTQANKRKRRK